MKNEIEQFKQEIQDYEIELKKLRSELNAKSAVAPQPTSGHPSEISAAFRAAAVTTAERVGDIQGLKSAIAALEGQLAQKRSQLQDLQQRQQHQQRLDRIQTGKATAKSVGSEINDLVSQLESKINELKAVCYEYEPDHRVLNSKPDFGIYWRPPEFIVFGQLVVPVFLENQGQLTLSTRPIDLFKPEKDAQQKAQAQRAREAKAATDAQILASHQRKVAEKQQRERERIEEILSVKKTELDEAEALRAKHMEQIARGVRLDLGKIDAFIASTNVEIEQLQNELDAVEQLV